MSPGCRDLIIVGGDTHDVNAAVRVRGHARRDRSPPCQPELRGVRCAEDNQIDVIASREFHHHLGDIAATEDPRLDLQASGEAQVLFYSLSFFSW